MHPLLSPAYPSPAQTSSAKSAKPTLAHPSPASADQQRKEVKPILAQPNATLLSPPLRSPCQCTSSPAQPSPAQSWSLAHKEHRPSVSLTGCLWCGERHLCCGTDKRGQKATVLEPDLDCNTWSNQFDEVPTSLTSFRHSSSETPTQAVLTQHHCPHHLPTVQRGRSKPVSVTSSMQPCVSRNKYSAL